MSFEQKQFLSAVEQLCDEKGISKDQVIETVEAALAAAYKRDYAKRGQRIRIELDELSGDMKVFLQREVVEIDAETNTITAMAEREVAEGEEDTTPHIPARLANKTTDPSKEGEEGESGDEEGSSAREYNEDRFISMEEAKEHSKKPELGDVIELSLEPPSDFGRIAAQTAKQVIIQRIREAERQAMFDEYSDKVGDIINGSVQRAEGRNVVVDLGRATGVLFPDEQIPREHYIPGQRLRVYLKEVDSNTRGSGVTLSRACPEFVQELFKLEVPEIFAGDVDVKAVAREAGSRTKIAVHTTDDSIDPVGACVGQKGTRIQTLISELNGEKIDVIEWIDDETAFIARALSPANILSIDVLDAEEKQARAVVDQDQLSLAIGKRGQNVRLAARLTGWNIDVRSTEQLDDSPHIPESKKEAVEEVTEEVVAKIAEESTSVKEAFEDAAKEEVVEEADAKETKPRIS